MSGTGLVQYFRTLNVCLADEMVTRLVAENEKREKKGNSLEGKEYQEGVDKNKTMKSKRDRQSVKQTQEKAP